MPNQCQQWLLKTQHPRWESEWWSLGYRMFPKKWISKTKMNLPLTQPPSPGACIYHPKRSEHQPAEHLNQIWPIFLDLQIKTDKIRPGANINIEMSPKSLPWLDQQTHEGYVGHIPRGQRQTRMGSTSGSAQQWFRARSNRKPTALDWPTCSLDYAFGWQQR